jgi:NADH:ubiquinone oxidoreductase subunit H
MYILLPIILSIALLTLSERKILGTIQRRKGPNIIGIYGLLQPLTDGVKLLIKESLLPQKSYFFFYILSPFCTFLISLLLWSIIPFNLGIIIFDTNLSLLFILAISTLAIYGILYGG